ncbi:hypothetical protein AHiyo8_09830 [Arthrobacter sp. Hiyo8]|nr:hypothetical protein AHiyo8_09830 [Arthrobacter sp. Hiyo8]
MTAVQGEEVDVVREAFGDAVLNQGLAAARRKPSAARTPRAILAATR